MYSSGIHFRAYHHASSPTGKCILQDTFSCLSSRFQSNTEMYTTGYIFVLAVSSRGLMSVVRSLLKLYAILIIPALPRLAQIIRLQLHNCTVVRSPLKSYYTIQSRRYLAYFSMLNLALDLSCGLTSCHSFGVMSPRCYIFIIAIPLNASVYRLIFATAVA